MGVLIVAIIQFNSLSDQTEAITKALELISEASLLVADIVLFPEMWVNSYRFFDPADPDGHQRWKDSALHEDDEPLASIARKAKNRGIAVAIGYLRKTDGEPENSCVVFDQHGSVRLVYSKVHICNFEIERHCRAGNEFPVVDLDTKTDSVRIGTMICYDREIPESARVLSLKGAELILVPNACVIDDHRVAQIQTRAFENQVAIAMANFPEPRFNGQSLAVDAVFYDESGRSLDPIVARGGSDEEMVFAEFDMDSIRRYRNSAIWGPQYRRPDAYGVICKHAEYPEGGAFEPRINGNIRNPLVAGKEEVR